MKKSYTAFLLLSSLSLMCFQPLQGALTETQEEKPRQEEQTVKSHATAQERIVIEKRLSKKEIREEQAARKKAAEETKAQAKRLMKKASSKMKTKAPCGFYNSYNGKPLYRIKSIGANGRTLTFDDETIWEISSSSTSVARSWAPGTYVVIIPNTRWFHTHTYRLENVVDHSAISADLSEGPFMKYAIFISFIDRMTNTIGLTDNSIWNTATDAHTLRLFSSWINGQAVLIGENRGWFGWPNGNILININENAYIPVRVVR